MKRNSSIGMLERVISQRNNVSKYIRRITLKKHLTDLREHLGSTPPPVFGGICVVHLFSFRCCALFVFDLRLVCLKFLVSLECPLLIALSVFSNVYLVPYTYIFLSLRLMNAYQKWWVILSCSTLDILLACWKYLPTYLLDLQM